MGAASRYSRVRRSTALLALASMGVGTMLAGSAHADDNRDRLRDKRHDVTTTIDQRQNHLDEISADLVAAQGKVDNAVADLQDARDKLADLRRQEAAAQRRDELMQERLDDAVQRLEMAQEDLRRGQENLEAKRDMVVSAEVASLGQGTSSMSLDVVSGTQTPDQLISSMSVTSAASEVKSGYLDDLRGDQVLLKVTEDRVAENKEAVQDRREEAARNLELKQDLATQAQQAADDVSDRVDTLRGARDELASAKQDELDRIGRLEDERDRIQNKLEEIARRRLAALRRERAAREARESATSSYDSSSARVASNSGGFIYPVQNAYITSPYGMRLHPVLHYWKLHDGTDFGVGCGTPVYAAAAGTITDEYYNEGYGNRVIIDHGIMNGASMATSYNHLTSFVAGVGEHVDQGQLIAYSGTTGYSTGCHLHFMVYVNGATVDPMNYY